MANICTLMAEYGAMCVIIYSTKGLKISSPLAATTLRGSVKQDLYVAGGALGLFQFGLTTNKRYSLDTPNHGRSRLRIS